MYFHIFNIRKKVFVMQKREHLCIILSLLKHNEEYAIVVKVCTKIDYKASFLFAMGTK